VYDNTIITLCHIPNEISKSVHLKYPSDTNTYCNSHDKQALSTSLTKRKVTNLLCINCTVEKRDQQ